MRKNLLLAEGDGDLERELFAIRLDPSASYELKDKHDNRKHEQNVDQTTDRLTGKSESQSPQNEQDQNDRPKHSYLPSFDSPTIITDR